MRRVPELDAVRGVAILMVLVNHTEFFRVHLPKPTYYLRIGVDLFFVLSGFLITEILLRGRESPGFYANFYARRSLRIWPIYYLVVAAVWLAGGPVFGIPLPARSLIHYLTFTQNVPFAAFELAHHPALRSTWTLAVEEQFYLVWPPVVGLLGGRRRWLTAVLAAVSVVAVVARARGGWYLQLVTHADAMALGALTAVALRGVEPGAPRRSWAVPALAGVGLAAASAPLLIRLAPRLAAALGVSGLITFTLDLFFFNVASAALVGLCHCAAGRPWLAPLRWRPLCYVGVISYGIYLYHRPIFLLFEQALGPRGYASLWVIPLLYAAPLAVAVLSWNLIERPILRLKDRWFSYQQAAAPPAMGAADPAPSG